MFFFFFFSFLSSVDFILKIIFFKNIFQNTITESISLDPDEARSFVGPDLGPNFLQRLSAEDKSPLGGKELIKAVAVCQYLLQS